MCLSVCLHVCSCTTCVQCLRRPDKGVRSLGTGILSGLVLLYGFWDSNLDSLEEQPVFLTAEPSVELLDFILTFCGYAEVRCSQESVLFLLCRFWGSDSRWCTFIYQAILLALFLFESRSHESQLASKLFRI